MGFGQVGLANQIDPMLAARIAALQQATRPRQAVAARPVAFNSQSTQTPLSQGSLATYRPQVDLTPPPQPSQYPDLPQTMPAPTGLPDLSNQVAAQERYKAFLPQQQPQTQVYNKAAATDGTIERHGVKDKLLHWLASLGKGFVMGGPVGAGIGAFSPNTIDRAIHRGITLPRLERQMNIEQGQQQQDTANKFKIADITGFDPQGNLTEEAQRRLMSQRSLDDNRLRMDADRDARQKETERWHDSTGSYRDRKQLTSEMNSFLSRVAPNAPPDEVRRAFRARFNLDLPESFDARRHQLIDTGSGWSSVVASTGQGTEATQNGKPIPSAKAAQAAWAQERTETLVAGGMARTEAQGQTQKEIARFNADEAMKRAKLPAKTRGGHGLRNPSASEAAPQSTGKRKLTDADVKAAATRFYKGDVAAARAALEASGKYELP